MAQKELTLTMTIGDSEDFIVTVTDDATTPNLIDLSKAVDGTAARPAILRWAAKRTPADDANKDAIAFKTSYFEDQIQVLAQTGPTLGQSRLLLDKPDTEDEEVGTFRWDLEVTRQDVVRPGSGSGTIAVVSGSVAVTGTATTFRKWKVGDVLQPLGGLNVAPVKITKIISDTSLEVEAAIFATEPVVPSYEVRRGKHKTARKGPFVLEQEVVSA